MCLFVTLESLSFFYVVFADTVLSDCFFYPLEWTTHSLKEEYTAFLYSIIPYPSLSAPDEIQT